jgi:hypothetical protein
VGIMMAQLYAALKEAGASEAKATSAAEEAASYENRLARIESDLIVIKWMLGGVGGGVLTLLVKAFVA